MASSLAVTATAPGNSRAAALREWREHWPVVIACLFGLAMGSLGYMSMGAFMAPMQAAFGWSRSDYAFGFSIHSIAGMILPAPVGWLIDRFGPRAVAVTGTIAAGLTFCLFATVTGGFGDWCLLWVAYGSASQLIFSGLWYTAAAQSFNLGRGLAIGVVMCGAAIAGVVGPPMANWLIELHGFRFAYLAMGLSWGAVVSVVAWLGMPGRRVRHRPTQAAPIASGLSFVEGLRAPAYYKLLAAIAITYFVLLALTLHVIPMLGEAGLGRNTAVLIASAFGLSLIVGKLAAGFANDRFSARLIAVLCNISLAASTAMLVLPGVGWSIAGVLLGGLSYGGVAPTYPYLISRYLGMRGYGRLFGIVAIVYAASSGAGPWVAGKVHDLTHSYHLLLLWELPALAVAVLLCLSLGRYPHFERPAD